MKWTYLCTWLLILQLNCCNQKTMIFNIHHIHYILILLLRKKKDILYKRSFFKKWLIDMRIEKISKHYTYTHTERDALWWCYTYIIDTKYETSITFILSKRKRTIIDRTSIQYIKSVEPKVMTIMIMIITIYTKRKKM
jgi:hypothetical protein